MLNSHTGDDLSGLKAAVNAVLDKFESSRVLEWNPHVGDHAMLANLQVILVPSLPTLVSSLPHS